MTHSFWMFLGYPPFWETTKSGAFQHGPPSLSGRQAAARSFAPRRLSGEL